MGLLRPTRGEGKWRWPQETDGAPTQGPCTHKGATAARGALGVLALSCRPLGLCVALSRSLSIGLGFGFYFPYPICFRSLGPRVCIGLGLSLSDGPGLGLCLGLRLGFCSRFTSGLSKKAQNIHEQPGSTLGNQHRHVHSPTAGPHWCHVTRTKGPNLIDPPRARKYEGNGDWEWHGKPQVQAVGLYTQTRLGRTSSSDAFNLAAAWT
jgi:hypothetical protein